MKLSRRACILIILGIICFLPLLSLAACNKVYNIAVECDYDFSNNTYRIIQDKQPATLYYKGEYILNYHLKFATLKDKRYKDIMVEVSFSNVSATEMSAFAGGSSVTTEGSTTFTYTVQAPEISQPKVVVLSYKVTLDKSQLTQDCKFSVNIDNKRTKRIQGKSISFSIPIDKAPLLEPDLQFDAASGGVSFGYIDGADKYNFVIRERNSGYIKSYQITIANGIATKTDEADPSQTTTYKGGTRFSHWFDVGGEYEVNCTAYSTLGDFQPSNTATTVIRI